ncbi:hypothetical protein JK151_17975 (plasmid) [Ralstonia syzygii subsp. celebesensis]|uniref:Uncharacterized protein n=2 Tax=Ralstonia syzygii subsp. celebesensis TaxID=1310168 RepID=A0A1U9VMR3_9RALS|nr:hypothetical protein B0B51_18980 [blood disease bacterium A2-HR MARDI]QQV57390.1 hypothetical protein JK151_17975 [Ralstonia syzygii subsp. celebesensis]CCA82734.1 hypothetical protein BDB_mp40019 [blood disease bacterium R229]
MGFSLEQRVHTGVATTSTKRTRTWTSPPPTTTLADAIDFTAALWMQRKTNGWLSEIYGIPRNLPHLTAFVAASEIADELSLSGTDIPGGNI